MRLRGDLYRDRRLGRIDAGPPCDAGVYVVQACTYDGTSHLLGDIFPSTDGCNTCECLWRWAYNEVACTLNNCTGSPVVDALPASTATAGSCVYNGATFPLDVYFSAANGCGECHCRVDGQVTCSLQCLRDAGPAPDGSSVPPDVASVYCNLDDGRRIPAGAAFSDGCNCCVCTSSAQSACQGAACVGDAAYSLPGSCQSDQDCLAQGDSTCVFDPGCDSPRGTCLRGAGVCPLFAVSDLGAAPSQYCGCDGVTYALTGSVTFPREYPYRPYRHVGACLTTEPGATINAPQIGGPDAGLDSW